MPAVTQSWVSSFKRTISFKYFRTLDIWHFWILKEILVQMVFALLVLDSCHSAKQRVMKKSGPVELKKFIFPAKKTEVANVLRLSSR